MGRPQSILSFFLGAVVLLLVVGVYVYQSAPEPCPPAVPPKPCPPAVPPKPCPDTSRLENCFKTKTCARSISEAQETIGHLNRPFYEPFFGIPYSNSDPAVVAELAVYLQHAQKLFDRKGGQMTMEQYSYNAQLMYQAAPCNVLVWGLGQDSGLWKTINRDGRTTFLEDSEMWISSVKEKIPDIDVRQTTYKHLGHPERSKTLLSNPTDADLLVELPEDVANTHWDIILVDAPALVRYESIWTTKRLLEKYCIGQDTCDTKGKVVHVLVHDCERPIESKWSDAFFGIGGYTKVEGLRPKLYGSSLPCLRHYVFGDIEAKRDADRLLSLAQELESTIV
eukprot:CAMPEP_0118933856 /NCGR_PEP_ID=MMETSP1169-20130426/12720_1 /TAXON_ID=36882 /ORGANISM="Pyramimonas obovata, Strain CCMP722" /LENGTH=336 /DNA_ID=CAMNT_0006876675 /DNA_START=162 /DNA_END=1172 /DNA_ORIENTATION=+